MYILGISGSPRIGGNTDILLDKALEGASSNGAEIEKIILNKLEMLTCQECEYTNDDGTCKIEDDFQGLYEKIKKADGVILASPIFFGSLSAQTKIMIDRFQCKWKYNLSSNKNAYNLKKPGMLILVEASARDSFLDNAKSIVKNFFVTAGMDYSEELLCKSIDAKGAILKQPEKLSAAQNLGRKLASACK